jgi:alcohol dehydrogenase class IV
MSSPIRFEFATATRIIFGPGALAQAGPCAREFGRTALVVTGRDTARASKLVSLLEGTGVSCVLFPTSGEPTTQTVEAGIACARESACELVIGLGGGAALDAGKAIAAMLKNPGTLLDYLEVVGLAKPLPNPGAPFIAIPTTAGTGSEVTRNAVLASLEHRVKVSLRSPFMLPKVAIVDPQLTTDLPPAITATTGLDALTQVVEPYLSIRANPMIDVLCLDAMTRVARSLRRAFSQSDVIDARQDMALASLYGGLALANAGLGAVHGIAGPLGGMFPAPHGAVCAALLPHAFCVNQEAVRLRGTADSLARFDRIAAVLTGRPDATAADAVDWLTRLVQDLGIPPLSTYGIQRSDFPEIVKKSAAASSMKANPVALSAEEINTILARAL